VAQDVAVNTYSTASVQPIAAGSVRLPAKLVASTTYPLGAILARQTSGGKYGLYASGGAGGLSAAEAVLARACKTDASSNITYADVSTGMEWGQTDQYADIFVKGLFFSGDLSGADAGYATQLPFRSLKGGAVIGLGD